MRFVYAMAALAALLIVAAACNGDDSSSIWTPVVTEVTGTPETAVFTCDGLVRTTVPDAAAFPLDVSDSGGHSVTLEAPPQHVASLSAGHTEILFAIGAGDQVTAVDNTSDCPRVVDGLPKVDAFTPSVEQISALEPDLVVIFFDPGDLQAALEGLGIPVLNLAAPESVEGVYEQTELLGKATGHADQAADLVADMRAAVDDVQSRVSGVAEAPTVFHEIDTNYFSAGSGTFIGDLYGILGAENIADATGQPYPQMSAEAIIQADPDVIVLADEDAGVTAETVKARPGWDEIAAVKEDRIYVVDPDIVSRPGPRLVEALRTLAAYLYPDVYP